MKISDFDRAETLVLGGLVRLMLQVDGEFTDDERSALQEVSFELGVDEFWQAVADAGNEFSNDDDIRAAAKAVQRQEVREEILGALTQIALSDTVSVSEQSMLDWLAKEWDVEIKTIDEEE